MTEGPVIRWRRFLEEWAIPQELIDAVPDSPYEWSADLWKRRTDTARASGEEPQTTGIVRSLLPPGGSLLDVGAGTGRASLPLAQEGFHLTAVEKNPGMAQALAGEAAALGVDMVLVEGAWPAVDVPVHDVAMCAHVVYDVQDIEPFLRAMAAHARYGVVVELTESHPWSSLVPYYRTLHDLDRPAGPTVKDFEAVVEDLFRPGAQIERWTRPGHSWFESWEEVVAYYGRRLVLPQDRWDELREVMAPEVHEQDGKLLVGSPQRQMATVWWTS